MFFFPILILSKKVTDNFLLDFDFSPNLSNQLFLDFLAYQFPKRNWDNKIIKNDPKSSKIIWNCPKMTQKLW